MLADYAFVDDVITAKEARLIRKHCMDRVEKSLVEGSKEVESRKSKNTFIKSGENLPKVIKDAITKILKVYFHVCQEIYKFPIETVEPIQFVEYGKGDYYDFHMDAGFGDVMDRDISASVVLSYANKYEGGGLKFRDLEQKRQPEEKIGRLIVFPSLMMHGVPPITKGKRSSLVLWGRRKIAETKKED
jgi:predicted 2-oxoglutarate/Fe(II)-dependent dioxygenase YbiX